MKIKPLLWCFIPLLLIAAVWFPACTGSSKTPRQDSKKRYNVVFIVSDALRQDVLGCYGGEARTPNIDRLAEIGILFENAYSTSSWAPPSAASMFTGNYASSYAYSQFKKTIRIHVPDSEVLFVEVLRQLGYKTIMKNENLQAVFQNCLQGFAALPKTVAYDKVISREKEAAIRQITNGRVYDNSKAYKDSFIFLRQLLDIPSDQSFFLHHWIIDPHEPYAPVRKFERRITINRSALTKPERYYGIRNLFEGEMSEEENKYYRARYIAEVESVDERIGYVLKIMDYKKIFEQTYFILTADHGEQFGEHSLYGHGGYYYEVLLRVPLIIAGPGLPKGKRIETNVSLISLMPTLKDLLGVDYENDTQGESLEELIFDRSKYNKPLFFDDVRVHDQIDALLENNFKLITALEDKFQLYDISKDPLELNNIATSNHEIMQSMLKKIADFREENKRRQAINITKIDPDDTQLTDEEKQEMLKELKALGYIK